MAISLAARDGTDLTLIGTRQGIVVTASDVVICSDIVGGLKVTILAFPETFWTGGGMVVQISQFPRPLTPTLLVGAANIQFVDGVTFEKLVFQCFKGSVVTHRTRLAISDDPLSSFL